MSYETLKLIGRIASTLGGCFYMVFAACEAMEKYGRKEYMKSLSFIALAGAFALMVAASWA